MKDPDGCTLSPRKGVSISAAEKATREMLFTAKLHVWRNNRVPKSEINLFTKQKTYFYTPIPVIFR
jgi:hypothetical protein